MHGQSEKVNFEKPMQQPNNPRCALLLEVDRSHLKRAELIPFVTLRVREQIEVNNVSVNEVN